VDTGHRHKLIQRLVPILVAPLNEIIEVRHPEKNERGAKTLEKVRLLHRLLVCSVIVMAGLALVAEWFWLSSCLMALGFIVMEPKPLS
jgi:uncharacterized RDD family membrane protein YckC